MDPVRVAFDVGPLAATRTGVGHAVAGMHESLNQRSDVELIDYLVSFRARPGPGVHRLPLPAMLAHRLWQHADRPRADRWLAGAQVVHGTNYVVPPAKAARVVSVYDCWFLRNPEAAGDDVRRAGRVLRRSVREGAAVHASSHATAAAVRELMPGADVTTVHLGALAPTPPPEKGAAPPSGLDGVPFVLAIGTVERRKNLPRLVDAFAELAGGLADVRLVLAGADGDDRPAVDAAIAALAPSVARRVLLTGAVDQATRAWLLHHAAVLAYPSLDEGFGFPLLDAMQVGVPLVASNAGSIPEVAGDAALTCAPGDVEGLAANLRTALTDTAERLRLTTAGEQRWRTFRWHECARGLAALYQRVAGGLA